MHWLGENPFGENPFGENPFGENAAPAAEVSNSTLYLAPTVNAVPSFHAVRTDDMGTYSLRVFQTVPNGPTTPVFIADHVTVGLVPHEPDVIPLPGGGFGFELTPGGLALREIAPGVDPLRSILPLMEFAPLPCSARVMPVSCFNTP